MQKAASMGDFAAFVALHQNYTPQQQDGKLQFNLPLNEAQGINPSQLTNSARNYNSMPLGDTQQKQLKKNIIKQRAGKGGLYGSKSNLQMT